MMLRAAKQCLAMMLMVFSSLAGAADFSLSGYQQPSGAISVRRGNDDVIDPYFAAKALLIAKDLGLRSDQPALAWIDWALQKQRADGRFDRYCMRAGQLVTCAASDADDAVLAVWLELLAKHAPASGAPKAWRQSMDRAEAYLDKLYDKQRGVYLVSLELPVALLMDNLEVYSALQTLGQFYSRFGEFRRAQVALQRAQRLRERIIRTFWRNQQQDFLASTQIPAQERFYPDQAAQLFPLLVDSFAAQLDSRATYRKWLVNHQNSWLRHAQNDYPWGLVAVAAEKMADYETAFCWLQYARPLRQGERWNVLEEAVFQALSARLGHLPETKYACKGWG